MKAEDVTLSIAGVKIVPTGGKVLCTFTPKRRRITREAVLEVLKCQGVFLVKRYSWGDDDKRRLLKKMFKNKEVEFLGYNKARRSFVYGPIKKDSSMKHSEIKTKVLNALKKIERPGMPEFLNWLENETDFFTAPASTKFHGAEPGGLLAHSAAVCSHALILNACEIFKKFNFNKESIIISALLHDVCKVNFYKETTRNVKNDKTGQWEKQPYYLIEDSHPYGHGECSVMLIEKFMKLTDEERYSVRWHMGGFDHSIKGGSFAINDAFKMFPMALLIHMADLSEASCYFVTGKKE